MFALIFDTETNGLPLFREPSSDPRQPHIVQLAAHLVDMESRKVIQSIDLIAEPDGWEIPDDVAAIHGITTERAKLIGIPEAQIVDAFMAMWRPAALRVAHNESFDARIIRIALKRFAGDVIADNWKEGDAECTCLAATPIMKLPPTDKMRAAGRNMPKKPSLSEAYLHFTGQELQDAHTAIADVNACMAVWYAIQDLESANAE